MAQPDMRRVQSREVSGATLVAGDHGRVVSHRLENRNWNGRDRGCLFPLARIAHTSNSSGDVCSQFRYDLVRNELVIQIACTALPKWLRLGTELKKDVVEKFAPTIAFTQALAIDRIGQIQVKIVRFEKSEGCVGKRLVTKF